MNYYKIDYKRLVSLLLPVILRGKMLIALLQAVSLPVAKLHASFMSFRNDILYKANHNGQVCYMEAMLNDNFDFTARRIYISDAESEEWGRMLWREYLDRPVMLRHDQFFMLQSERFIGADGIDFVANIPIDLNIEGNELQRMNSLIRYYKYAGMRYTIRYI
ncbi:MAG: hypothetical protein E6767_20375 [Dysgonomonas sp.]|nr:hypothetical protein [Dysgonomonas sp.]